MGRLRDALEAFEKAMRRLKSALLKARDERGSELYEFFRDCAIQRFEFTYELLWKCVKFYLYEVHGIVCNSPRMCLREYLSMSGEAFSEEEGIGLFRLVDLRNLTAHTYDEELAEEIFRELEVAYSLMEKVLYALKR